MTRLFALVAVAMAACSAEPPSEGAPSGDAPSAAQASASAEGTPAIGPVLSPKTMQRRTTPAALNAKLDAACTAGDGRACMALADRQLVGCGVARKRSYPTLMQLQGEYERDFEAYQRAMRRGCKTGLHEACDARFSPRGTDSDPFAKEKRWTRPKDDPFPAASEACKKNKHCDSLYVALDRWGFSPSELAPVRVSFSQILADRCLEGDCTCGDATKFMEESDARWFDLAVLGCENGEAEGCYALARAYDTGTGVEKDAAKAAALYDLSCPPLVGGNGQRSPRACDHIAALAIGDVYPGKDRATAKHYAQAACGGGTMFHQHCVRLAMLWATRKEAGRNAHEARMVAMGETHFGGERSYDDDCRRPSVAKECAELKEALKTARKE